MGRQSGLRSRLRALFSRKRFERELDDELRFHVEMETEARLRGGAGASEARRGARVAFGGEDSVRESVREARGLSWLDDLRMDARYAARSLWRNRLFAIVAVVTLGLGIGAATAVYSVVDGVLLRPLPFAQADRLVMVWEHDRISGTEREAASIPDFADFEERSRTIEPMAAFDTRPVNLMLPGQEPERVRVALVTERFFETLGVTPLLGRFFQAGDAGINAGRVLAQDAAAGAALVTVVSEELWRTRLGGDASVIGSTILVDDMQVTVIGVARSGLEFPEAETALWAPQPVNAAEAQRTLHDVVVVGRLAPGHALEAAQAEMTAIAAELEAMYPSNRGRGVTLEPVRDALVGQVRPALLILLAAVALVLLVACVNVANLLLARGAARTREVAIRGALGAGGSRLARQFAVESLMLAVLGGVLGVGLAALGLERLLALAPADLPRAAAIGIDARVLLASLGVTLAVGLAFGLVPVQQARRVDLQSTLREEGRSGSAGVSRQRTRSALVVIEIALSVMLLVGAGLMMRSLSALQSVDPGFVPDNLLRVQYVLPESRYPQSFSNFPNWTEVQRFQSEVRARIGSVPGVASVALATQDPLGFGFTNSFVIEGRENEYENQPEIATRMASTGYFETVGVPVLSGRAFDDRDVATTPLVVVINQAGAERFFPGQNPIGQRIGFWGQFKEIVGVVGDERFHGLGEAAPPALYMPLAQAPLASGSILVRTSVPPLSIADAVRAQVREVDPDLAVYGIATMDDELQRAVGRERFAATLLGLFAATGLLLALIGVHGLLSYTVAQRTRELGIRMALGATASEVVTMVVKKGLGLAAIGLAIGVAGALAVSGLLRSMLFGVAATDPVTFAVVGIAILGTALLACLAPARRATAADPMHALRVE